MPRLVVALQPDTMATHTVLTLEERVEHVFTVEFSISAGQDVTIVAGDTSTVTTSDLPVSMDLELNLPKEAQNPDPSNMVPPVPLLACGIPSLDVFSALPNLSTSPANLAFEKEHWYFRAHPSRCNGQVVEVFWLPPQYWTGCQLHDGYYRIKVPAAIGPKGIPVVWRELRALPSMAAGLVGVVVSHSPTPAESRSPKIIIGGDMKITSSSWNPGE